MKKQAGTPSRALPTLRQKAEAAVRASRSEIARMPAEEIQRLVYELQVHQVELEMQNEELRHTQADLAQSRDRFHALYDFAPVAYVTLVHDGTILEANLTLATMLGRPRESLIGRKLTRFVAADAQDAFHLHQRAVLASEGKQTCELRFDRADGTTLSARLESIAHMDEVSGRRHCRSAIVDITERKRTENELARMNATLEEQVAERTAELMDASERVRADEERLRLVLKASRIGTFEIDFVSGETHWNTIEFELLGLKPGEAPASPETFLRFVHPDDVGRVRAQWEEATRTGEFDAEFRIVRADGEDRWLAGRGRFISNGKIGADAADAGKQPARFMGVNFDITERRQVKEALRASESRYRQLIHGLPAAVYTCDAKGRLKLYNAAAVKLWGREPKPGVEKWGGAFRVLTPEGKRLSPARYPIAMALRQGEPIRGIEMIVERPDGSRSHVVSFPDPIYDSSGAVIGAVNMLIDITALKVAESSLRTSERQLHTLSRVVEQSPASVLITTPSGEIDYVNPRFTELTGYSLEEVLGKTPRFLKSGVHPPELYEELWKMISTGGVWRSVLCNRKKNGALFWEFTVIAPILDEHGAITHFVSIKEDITERREAAAALMEREARLRAILNTVRDAIITIDRRGIITGVNPATEAMFGYAEAEMIGENVRLLMPSPYREEHDGYLANYARTGTPRIIGVGREVQAQRKDGSVFPIELAVSEVKDMQLYTGVIRDITERKRFEAEVLRIAEEERMRVAADLHDGICQEIVGTQFVASALRRDLEKAGDPRAPQARRIEDTLGGTAEHTRQLAHGLNPVVADGTGLMHALRRLAAMTGLRGVRCAFQCPGPISIESPTKANELYRIAQEAIHNAVRHSGAKRIVVHLSAADGEACLSVKDDGCGLPAGVATVPGMGLRLMRYRAGLIGGHFVIQPRKSRGTEVICRVPNTLP